MAHAYAEGTIGGNTAGDGGGLSSCLRGRERRQPDHLFRAFSKLGGTVVAAVREKLPGSKLTLSTAAALPLPPRCWKRGAKHPADAVFPAGPPALLAAWRRLTCWPTCHRRSLTGWTPGSGTPKANGLGRLAGRGLSSTTPRLLTLTQTCLIPYSVSPVKNGGVG